jgi:hypothetical protein
MQRLALVCGLLLMILTACGRETVVVPTRIPSIEAVATNDFLTSIAPPVGMRERVSLPRVDDNTVLLTNWRADASFRFEGVFSGTPRILDAETDIDIWYNQTGNRRRVVIGGSGELFGDEDFPAREGVRVGGDTYLLIDGECYGSANGDAAILADLRIGDILGGVTHAIPAGQRQVLHGQTVWKYDFDLSTLTLPLLRMSETSAITAMEGELWVAHLPPNQTVAIRYYVNLQVENASLRLFESSLPVTGLLQIRYDLHDVGIDPNITPPNGC